MSHAPAVIGPVLAVVGVLALAAGLAAVWSGSAPEAFRDGLADEQQLRTAGWGGIALGLVLLVVGALTALDGRQDDGAERPRQPGFSP